MGQLYWLKIHYDYNLLCGECNYDEDIGSKVAENQKFEINQEQKVLKAIQKFAKKRHDAFERGQALPKNTKKITKSN